MLYIDVGNTLRGGLRTGIQRIVRSLAYHIALRARDTTRLLAFDVPKGRYFALSDPSLICSAFKIEDIPPHDRLYIDFDAFAAGDVFFEPDSTWTEPLNRGSLYQLLKRRGVFVVVLNHDVIPIILPEVCHPNTLVAFPECLADQLSHADFVLTTSNVVDGELRHLAKRLTGRSLPTRVIVLGSDFRTVVETSDEQGTEAHEFASIFPELGGLRYLLAVGTIEPRKDHLLLLSAFERCEYQDAALVVVGRKGWMSDEFLTTYQSHRDYGRRLFWYTGIDDADLRELYRHAYACVIASRYEGYGLPAVEALSLRCATICSDAGALAETTQGCAAIFPSGDSQALFRIIDRVYADSSFHAELSARAAKFEPVSWSSSARSVSIALDEISRTHGLSHLTKLA